MSHTASNLRISIIGAGNLGGTLAGLFTQAGYKVKIANSRGPETLTEVAQRTGATAATVENALKDANVIIVTIPQKAVVALDKSVFSELPADTIVIDTGNYSAARDGTIAEFESESLSESEWVEKQIGRPVIKCFNTIAFHSLEAKGKPPGTAGRVALPLAGDNAAHKAIVFELLDHIGFDGVDTGSLSESWRQQPGTPVYCCDWDVENTRRGLSRADRSRSHTVRDIQIKVMIPAMAPGQPKEQLILVSRQVMAEQYAM